LALDGTESGEAAVSFATALARQNGSLVRVIHVNELLIGGRGFATRTELESMEIVDEAVGYLRNEGVAADGVHYLANCFTIADRIGARMRSRLFEMCRTVNVDAPDFRREVRQSGRAGAR